MTRQLARALTMVLVGVLLLSTAPVIASPVYEDAPWRAEFYNNTDLSGEPAVVRQDTRLDFDWKLGSPDWRVQPDNFSARWTRTVKLEWSGNYRFYINSDDGLRVWVDDILVMDEWFDQQDAWTTADIYLAEGTHNLKVEYYEHVGAAMAKVVFQPEGDGTGEFWKAEYYTNPTLEGDVGVTAVATDISFNWGTGSPAEWIPAQWFSARFTRDVIFAGGAYQFTVTAEGGVRLYVDETLILDEWHETDKRTYTANATLSAAVHRVRLEYYDTWRSASLVLRWQPALGGGGWQGEYFDTETPGSTPAMTREDKTIDFDWDDQSPFVGMPREHWSARWTRTLSLAAGYYRFTTITDDGVRLWVDGNLIIDQWVPNDGQPFWGDAYLASGSHASKMEYYNLTGKALARLTWQQMNTTDLVAILDDGDPGFATGGAGSGWNMVYYGYGGRSRWTSNRAGYWARWTPALPKLGRYEVFVFVPWVYNQTSTARYYLKHEGDVIEFWIDQRAMAGQWVSLGTFTFNANNTEFVHLEAASKEPADTRAVAFDAVKWVYRGP